jgi:hypothetical protein
MQPNFILPKSGVHPKFFEVLEYVKDYVSGWDWGTKQKNIKIRFVQNLRAFGRQTLTGVTLRRNMPECQTAMVLVHELRHVLNAHTGRFSRKDYVQFSRKNYKEYVTQPEEVDCNQQAYYFGVEFYPKEYSSTVIYQIYLDSMGR